MKIITSALITALSLSGMNEVSTGLEDTVEEECPRIEGPRVLQVGEVGKYSLKDENCETPYTEEGEPSADVWLLYTDKFFQHEDMDNNAYTMSLGFNEPGFYALTYKGDFSSIVIEVRGE